MKKEASDKVVIGLLVVLVVVSLFGAYMVYDVATSNEVQITGQATTQVSSNVGQVGLEVINPNEVETS